MTNRLRLLQEEINITEGWLDYFSGKPKAAEPQKPKEKEFYKFSQVGHNLYVGPRPPRFDGGKIKVGVGAIYQAKTLGGIQNEEIYEKILREGVIYGLAEDLNNDSKTIRAKTIKSGKGYSFEDVGVHDLQAMSRSNINITLRALKHAAEEIYSDSQSRLTLVTCIVGQNRSASAAALALVLGGLDPVSAIKQVRAGAANHLGEKMAIKNDLFKNYILMQQAGEELIDPNKIPIEEFSKKTVMESLIRQIVRG